MATPDSSILLAAAEAHSVQRFPSEHPAYLDSNLTRSTPRTPVSLSERAVVTYDTRELRLYIYHGADRLSTALTIQQAVQLAHDLLGKALEATQAVLQTRP